MINIIVKVWGKEGNSSNTGRHEKQQRGSIMRKQKKKREEVNKAHHQLNKDDMQLTIENIMLLSGRQCFGMNMNDDIKMTVQPEGLLQQNLG